MGTFRLLKEHRAGVLPRESSDPKGSLAHGAHVLRIAFVLNELSVCAN